LCLHVRLLRGLELAHYAIFLKSMCCNLLQKYWNRFQEVFALLR
jgi:hypothetical protein